MAGMAGGGDTQAVGVAQERQHGGISFAEGAVVSPSGEGAVGGGDGAADVSVVLRADGVSGTAQDRGGRGAVGEEVHDFKTAAIPGAGEADAAADRWIVAKGIGGAGVQHHDAE